MCGGAVNGRGAHLLSSYLVPHRQKNSSYFRRDTPDFPPKRDTPSPISTSPTKKGTQHTINRRKFAANETQGPTPSVNPGQRNDEKIDAARKIAAETSAAGMHLLPFKTPPVSEHTPMCELRQAEDRARVSRRGAQACAVFITKGGREKGEKNIEERSKWGDGGQSKHSSG